MKGASEFKEPLYAIGVVAKMVNCHPQTIRYYERQGLIKPRRTAGGLRMFSRQDIERLEKIQSFTELGVNLAGVEMLLRLLDNLEELKREMERDRQAFLQELKKLKKFNEQV